MGSFVVCINAVLPIFLLMAAGYAARCFHLLDRADVEKINRIVFRAFMPVMVFYNIYCSELSSAMRGSLLGFRGVELVSLLGVFASSTAIASFTMAQQMGGDAELAGDIVVSTSALCSFTLFGWSLLFKLTGLI